MLRRTLLLTAAVALAMPGGATRAHEREDDFDEEWGYLDAPGSDAEVDVDMADPAGSVTFETFENNLAPHGQWVTVGSYGRVWRPLHVHSGWRPYYDGAWQWTDEGWLWVSSEPWGWATYHYGRWAYDAGYGWVWIPGYEWAPAWVSWRFGVDFVGWAPLGPGLSVYVTSYPVVYDHWVFVPCNRFVGVPVHSVAWVGPARVGGIWSRTHPAPPRAVVMGSHAPAWGGPARPFIERQGGRQLTPVRVQPMATPQAVTAAPRRNGVVPVFRPEARPARPAGRGSAPASSGAVVAPPPRQGGVPSVSARPGAVGAPSSAWRSNREQAPLVPRGELLEPRGVSPAPGPAPGRAAGAPSSRPAPSRGAVVPPTSPAPSRGAVVPPTSPAPGRGAITPAPRSAPPRGMAPPPRAAPGHGGASPRFGAAAGRSSFAAAPSQHVAPRAAPGRSGFSPAPHQRSVALRPGPGRGSH